MEGPQYPFLASREAFAEFRRAWEAGTLPKAEWTHAAHVAMAACYVVEFGDGAFERMKAGIIRYNLAVGGQNTDTSGYHETLTRLWSNVIATEVAGITCPWAAAVAAAGKYGAARDLHARYYSFDVVKSVQARREWIPPDLAG